MSEFLGFRKPLFCHGFLKYSKAAATTTSTPPPTTQPTMMKVVFLLELPLPHSSLTSTNTEKLPPLESPSSSTRSHSDPEYDSTACREEKLPFTQFACSTGMRTPSPGRSVKFSESLPPSSNAHPS